MGIAKQIAYVKSNEAVLTQKYDGKYLVVSEQLDEKAFDTLDEAYLFGVNNFGAGNFLLQQFCSNGTHVHIINQTITTL